MSSSDRGTETSVRADVAAWVAVLLAALFLALGCDAAENGRPTADGAQLRGRILYGVSTPDPFATSGRLFSLNLEDGERKPLADDVGQVMTSDGRRVVVVKYGPETVGRYGPYVPTLLLIDLATGATTAIGTGTGPRLGPEGRLAYCKTDGQSDPRVVVVRLERPDEITEVAGPYVNCPIMAWSRDGRLAFLAPAEEGGADGAPDLALYLYQPDGAGYDELMLPRHFLGSRHLSWSADGTRIAFSPGSLVAVADLQAREVHSVRLEGYEPMYSPTDPAVFATLVPSDPPQFNVYKDEALVASFSPPQIQARIEFTWSPDGEWLAIAAFDRLVVWNWKTNESRTLVEELGILEAVLWVP